MDIEYKCECIVSILEILSFECIITNIDNAKPIHRLRVQMYAKCDASSAFYLKTLMESPEISL